MIAKRKRFEKGTPYQTIFLSLFLGLLVLVIIGFLIISNWKMNQKRAQLRSEIARLEEEIRTLEKKNQELKTGVSQVSDKSYLEKVAREKFLLGKEGEEMVVVSLPEEKEKPPKKEKSFWQKILEKLKF